MLLWALAINNILAWGVKYPNTTSLYKYDGYTDQVFTQVENRRNILLCVPTSFSQVINRIELMWVYDYWGSVSTCSLFITSLCPPPLLPHSPSAVRVSCQIALLRTQLWNWNRSRGSDLGFRASYHLPITLPWEVISYARADIQRSYMKIHSPRPRKYSEGQHENPFNSPHKNQIYKTTKLTRRPHNLRKSFSVVVPKKE